MPAPPATIVQDYVGAVAAIWGDEPDGPLTATLAFRIGEADERLRTRGRCHLVRALVMDALEEATSPGDIRISASVRTLRTRFTVTGDDQAVAKTLNTIARAIVTLRTDRIDALLPGLITGWKAPESWDTKLMSLRYGSRGYGLAALPLLGLTDLDVAAFTDWTHTWFNAHNTVVSANRRPPEELNLSVFGDGIHKPLPDPHQINETLPASATGPDNLVAVSILSRYDATTRLGLDIVLDRVHRRCQAFDAGISRPKFVVRRTGSGLATSAIAIEVPNALVPEVRDAVSSDLFTLSMRGPTDEELGRAQISLRRSHGGSRAHVGTVVEQRATEALYREDHGVDAALHASPKDVAKVFRDALPRSIWLSPPTQPATDRRLSPVMPVVASMDDGEGFLPAPTGAPQHPTGARLKISATAIVAQDGTGWTAKVRFDDLVATEIREDGARILWSVDGTTLRVTPSRWQDAERVETLLANHIPSWVCLHPRDKPEGGSDQPDTAATDR